MAIARGEITVKGCSVSSVACYCDRCGHTASSVNPLVSDRPRSYDKSLEQCCAVQLYKISGSESTEHDGEEEWKAIASSTSVTCNPYKKTVQIMVPTKSVQFLTAYDFSPANNQCIAKFLLLLVLVYFLYSK